MIPLPKIYNYRTWLPVSLFLTGIYFWIHVYSNYQHNQPFLGHFVTDSHEYYDSAENFFTNGAYSPDVRTPGAGIIYLVLRVLFSKTTTLNIILIFQWILSAVSAYVLSKTISRLVKKESVFYFIFFLLTLPHFAFSWNTFYLTEGFCIPFFIFSIHYLHSFSESESKKNLFLAGLFMAWCVFLRPVFFIFLGLVAVFLLYRFMKKKTGFKTILAHLLIFLSVFLIFDSIWIIRNYSKKNTLVFLNDISGYTIESKSAPYSSLYNFMQSWGGDLQNQMFWFEPESNTDYSKKDTTMPSYMYTTQFNGDSLLLVKQRFKIYSRTHSDSLLALINNSLQNYTASVKKEKSFLYYFGSGFIYFKKIILSGFGTPGTSNKELRELTGLKKIIKISIALLFYLIFFTGMIFSVLLLFRKATEPVLKLLIAIAFINIIFICFYFRVPEFRYLLPSTIVFICITGIVSENAWDKIKHRFISVKQ